MPDVKYAFTRGNTTGIDSTDLVDGQILFDKEARTIAMDAMVDGSLTRIVMGVGDKTFTGIISDWEALSDNEKAKYTYVNITDDYEHHSEVMKGATATSDGSAGLAPQPLIGDQNKALFGDATYKAISAVALSGNAEDLIYDNSDSGMTATDVQAAIDELDNNIDVHIADTNNPHNVTKSQIGLGNVDNTSDLNKPISTATQNALNAKEDKTSLGTAAYMDVATSGDASASQIVMGNDSRLDDARPASDVSAWAKAATKPSYTASEVGAIASTQKGANNGVAELDANGLVPSSQLPSYVDDVLEFDSVDDLPLTGETGKIYVVLDTNKTYRWSGSAYVVISPSLALGETSSTAYRGDRGKTAYNHSQTTSGNPHNVTKSDVGLGNVGNYKAVSTEASQGLTDTEKSNARTNIGAGTSSLTLGTSSTTAYRGDRGNSAYAHAVTNKGAAFESGLYKITTNAEGHVTAATAVAKADITALGIPASDTDTIPSAYCTTAAATAAKTASCTGYALLSKSYIQVIIATANTAESKLTLNINGKGAKTIYIDGAVSSATNFTLPAGSYLVYYNGTNYYFRTDGKITGSVTGDAATVGGKTVGANVPADAAFTDTLYPDAVKSIAVGSGANALTYTCTQYDDSTFTFKTYSWAGYCYTAADDPAKVVLHTSYQLTKNMYTYVTIASTNTAAEALTLNINGKGAKPIYINGSVSSATNYSLTRGTYLVYYNGTNYYFRTDGKLTASITGDAATVGGKTVAANVPSDAKFTDTTALGSMTGTLALAHGGTGATTAAAARTNLVATRVYYGTSDPYATSNNGDIWIA